MTTTFVFRVVAPAILVYAAMGCTPKAPEADRPGSRSGGRIGIMQFRPVPDSSDLLGPRVENRQGGYSFRPPGKWRPIGVSAQGAARLTARMRFGDAHSGDFVDIGMLAKPPENVTEEFLLDSRNSVENTLRAAGGDDLLGVDLFKFKENYAIQAMTKKGATVVLQLLLFTTNARAGQISFSLGADRYRPLARTVEACIASFEWMR